MAADDDPVRRLGAQDRWATAAILGHFAHRDREDPLVKGDTLWVATGFAFADALAAGATGAGPVLLVAGDTAPDITLQAAFAFAYVERVRAVGGPAAVGDEAVQAVGEAAGVADVGRGAGADRFATAAAVSRWAHPEGAEVAYVATGLAFADALTAAPAAADDDAPVLLAADAAVPEATRAELARLAPEQIVVVGGEAAVAPDVQTDLAAYADDVTRVAGAGRFATAAAVSQHRGIAAEEAFGATGEDFPDVLAAAPAAISTNSALLLTGQGTLPEATRAEIARLEVKSATVAGHQSAVSDTVADEIRRLLAYDPTVDG